MMSLSEKRLLAQFHTAISNNEHDFAWNVVYPRLKQTRKEDRRAMCPCGRPNRWAKQTARHCTGR